MGSHCVELVQATQAPDPLQYLPPSKAHGSLTSASPDWQVPAGVQVAGWQASGELQSSSLRQATQASSALHLPVPLQEVPTPLKSYWQVPVPPLHERLWQASASMQSVAALHSTQTPAPSHSGSVLVHSCLVSLCPSVAH